MTKRSRQERTPDMDNPPTTQRRSDTIRGHAQRALARRTPWNAPWWIYVVAIGAANIARQLLLPDDVSTAVQIATFVATVLGVGLLVTLVYRWMTASKDLR